MRDKAKLRDYRSAEGAGKGGSKRHVFFNGECRCGIRKHWPGARRSCPAASTKKTRARDARIRAREAAQ